VQRLARISTRYTHGSAPLCAAEPATATATEQPPQIVFPREGPGMNYALNWALCAKGVTPKGEAYRNLREAELKKLNASIPEVKATTSVYARGSYMVGATEISKPQFKRLFKEVTSYLTSSEKLYVHDGAVGSSPLFDVKVRTISDNPSSALLFRSILEPASTSKVSPSDFPFTLYIASNFSPADLKSFGLSSEAECGFIVVDTEHSAMILGGSAFTDTATVKRALAALAAPSILSRGALPLSARLLVKGGSTIVLFAPESVVQKNGAVLQGAVSSDLGLVWSKDGVARLFGSQQADALNFYKAPSSLVLVTADSTGAVPEISKLTPEKAAALFVAGYNGDKFQPAYQAGPVSVDPVELGKELTALLENTKIPAFLINASSLSEKDLVKYIDSTLSEKLPKSKGKKPSESAGTRQSSTAPSGSE